MNVRSVNLFFVLAILASASLFYRRHQGEKVEIDRLEEGLANMMSGLSPAKAFFFETTAAEIPLLFWCRNAVFPVFLDKGAGAAGDTVLLVCPADVAEPASDDGVAGAGHRAPRGGSVGCRRWRAGPRCYGIVRVANRARRTGGSRG